LIKAKQRVPALRDGQPDGLAAMAAIVIKFRCGAPRRDAKSRLAAGIRGMSVKESTMQSATTTTGAVVDRP